MIFYALFISSYPQFPSSLAVSSIIGETQLPYHLFQEVFHETFQPKSNHPPISGLSLYFEDIFIVEILS